MEEHLLFAACFWHTFCWPGSDVFGGGTFNSGNASLTLKPLGERDVAERARALAGEGRAGHDRGGPVVAAHGVERDAHALGHVGSGSRVSAGGSGGRGPAGRGGQ